MGVNIHGGRREGGPHLGVGHTAGPHWWGPRRAPGAVQADACSPLGFRPPGGPPVQAKGRTVGTGRAPLVRLSVRCGDVGCLPALQPRLLAVKWGAVGCGPATVPAVDSPDRAPLATRHNHMVRKTSRMRTALSPYFLLLPFHTETDIGPGRCADIERGQVLLAVLKGVARPAGSAAG